MKKMLTAGALALAVMMVVSSAQAENVTYSGTYTGSLVGAGLWVNNDDPDVGPIVGDFGGYSFEGWEGTPLSVSIADVNGGDLLWSASQDLDADLTSGEPGEPSVSGCGTGGDLSASAVPFVAGTPLTVFIRSMASVNRNTLEYRTCPGLATRGTITLTVEQ